MRDSLQIRRYYSIEHTLACGGEVFRQTLSDNWLCQAFRIITQQSQIENSCHIRHIVTWLVALWGGPWVQSSVPVPVHLVCPFHRLHADQLLYISKKRFLKSFRSFTACFTCLNVCLICSKSCGSLNSSGGEPMF